MKFDPPRIESGWLGEVRRAFRNGEIGRMTDAQLLAQLTRTERRSVKTITGSAPKTLLRRWRVHYGLWLMKSKGYSTSRAAVEAGFFDSSHFTKATRAIAKRPPSEAVHLEDLTGSK